MIDGLRINSFCIFSLLHNTNKPVLALVCCCGLTVIVWRAEGVVGHAPARWEDDKVCNGHTWACGFGSQHSEDGGILSEIKKHMFLRSRLHVYSL